MKIKVWADIAKKKKNDSALSYNQAKDMFVEEIKQFLNYMDILDTDKFNQASLT